MSVDTQTFLPNRKPHTWRLEVAYSQSGWVCVAGASVDDTIQITSHTLWDLKVDSFLESIPDSTYAFLGDKFILRNKIISSLPLLSLPVPSPPLLFFVSVFFLWSFFMAATHRIQRRVCLFLTPNAGLPSSPPPSQLSGSPGLWVSHFLLNFNKIALKFLSAHF